MVSKRHRVDKWLVLTDVQDAVCHARIAGKTWMTFGHRTEDEAVAAARLFLTRKQDHVQIEQDGLDSE